MKVKGSILFLILFFSFSMLLIISINAEAQSQIGNQNLTSMMPLIYPAPQQISTNNTINSPSVSGKVVTKITIFQQNNAITQVSKQLSRMGPSYDPGVLGATKTLLGESYYGGFLR